MSQITKSKNKRGTNTTDLRYRGFPDGSDGKESACNGGDLGSIPESGSFPGEGNVYPL